MKSTPDWVWFVTAENNEVSFANNFDNRLLDKPLLFFRNSKGSRNEPWGTLAFTLANVEYWPIRKTLCFLLLKKSDKFFKRLSALLFC